MDKLAYPTTRPINRQDRTGYLVNRNTKFYKTLLAFDLAQLPIQEIQVESHNFYTNKTINFKGNYLELLRNYDAFLVAQRLVESEHRYGSGPLRVSDWINGTMVSMFFSRGESSNDKFIIVWEAAE